MDVHCREVLAVAPAIFQPDAWDKADTVIQLNLAGPKGGLFFLEITGRQLHVSEGTAPQADVTVETQDELFVRIALNLANPMLAYMKRQIRVRGNVKTVLKLLDPKVLPRDFHPDMGLAR